MFVISTTATEMDGHAGSSASLITLPFKSKDKSKITPEIFKDIMVLAVEEAFDESIEEIQEEGFFINECFSGRSPRKNVTAFHNTYLKDFIQGDRILFYFNLFGDAVSCQLMLVTNQKQLTTHSINNKEYKTVSTYGGTG